MKSFKVIALGAFLTLSTFCAVLYSSCSKDACKGVTCNNGGTCSGGNCTCVSGYFGSSCDSIYRNDYTHTYQGTATDNGTPPLSYPNYRLVFATTGTDINTMQLTIQDATGGSAGVPILTITLANYTSTGATFTVVSTSNAGFTYTGSGSVSGTTASLTLTETGTASTTVYTFTNFAKQ